MAAAVPLSADELDNAPPPWPDFGRGTNLREIICTGPDFGRGTNLREIICTGPDFGRGTNLREIICTGPDFGRGTNLREIVCTGPDFGREYQRMGTGLTSGFIPAVWWWSHRSAYRRPSSGLGTGCSDPSPPRAFPLKPGDRKLAAASVQSVVGFTRVSATP
ncbi:hypothetical protein AB0M48_11360 [Lentzea sp. NPDC051208]|uniref:hypothetical protein n=1 Tax=Lentzea sp. NPDC051208 TaxID=3154642 RepID=UPI0034373ABB